MDDRTLDDCRRRRRGRYHIQFRMPTDADITYPVHSNIAMKELNNLVECYDTVAEIELWSVAITCYYGDSLVLLAALLVGAGKLSSSIIFFQDSSRPLGAKRENTRFYRVVDKIQDPGKI